MMEPTTLDRVEVAEAAVVVLPLAAALAMVEIDSRDQAERYLAETTVPHGGE